MKPPDDVGPVLRWFREEIPGGFRAWAEPSLDAHPVPCRVYWGSHGCARPHGHDGPHWCDCCECDDHPASDEGCVAGPPYYGPDTKFYGEDA